MVRIRLKKVGRRHQPSYRFAAVDVRKARGSRVIEELGVYDPAHVREDRRIILKADRISYWLGVGAQPSDTVRRVLEKHQLIPAK